MKQENSKMWLRCEVTEGQFDGEFAVSGDTPDGAGFSLFAPSEFVRVDGPVGSAGVPGFVQVNVLDKTDLQALVKLPRRTMENGSTITVRMDDLETSPICQDA